MRSDYTEGWCDACGEQPVLHPPDDPDGFVVCENCEPDGWLTATEEAGVTRTEAHDA